MTLRAYYTLPAGYTLDEAEGCTCYVWVANDNKHSYLTSVQGAWAAQALRDAINRGDRTEYDHVIAKILLSWETVG